MPRSSNVSSFFATTATPSKATAGETFALLCVVRALADALGKDVSLSIGAIFARVAVAGDAGVDMGQLAEDLGLSSPAVSRAVQSLGRIHYSKTRAGLDLVEREVDPVDNRRRVLRLTPAGHEVLRRLAAAAKGVRP